MIIYKNNKINFIRDVEKNKIVNILETSVDRLLKRKTSISEINSWNNSLKEMVIVLYDRAIPDNTGIALEYNISRTSKRIDLVISGKKNEKWKLIIVELKQWQECKKVEGSNTVVETFLAGKIRETVHPSYQAFSYSTLLKDFTKIIQENKNIKIESCAYLHNYLIEKAPDIMDNQYKIFLERSPIFLKGETEQFRDFIKENITEGDNCELIEMIDESPITPGKSIQKFLKEIIDGKEIFTLIDEQRTSYEKCLQVINEYKKTNSKKVIIIPGGPGTGKTIIALRLLSSCIQKGLNTVYVSKNESLRNGYKKIILENDTEKTYSRARIDNMFYGSAKFSNLTENNFDCTIVDEAHRLIERHQYTPKNKGYNNQIQEIICESKVSIFFIDEKQIVTTKDIGTIQEIKRCAEKEGILKENIFLLDPLETQFRSSGADDYIDFIDNLIYGENKNVLDFTNKFDIKIFDTPNEMYKKLLEKNTNNNARLLAGYCWDWVSKNDINKNDIKIGDFEIKWNLLSDKYYMFNESSIDQAGCIHTSQGLEKEYIGVIIGPDMIYRNNKVIVDYSKKAKSDISLKGIGKLNEIEKQEIADKIIKNTYRVLLTRAIKGCYIYCSDKELNNYIRTKLKELSSKIYS
ncbi:DUF2075 domain-containing protein [Mesoplasma florum]|uniref:DUF2075 domain-containing protein n=1 Tax=Mesoplasma florum TaxID=2151 RepID=UPI000D096425|nr:DUF2075 domain-containing protein [Mesoplasma florum]AVN60979.1 ATP-binding protein [Mesoplasma florum]